MGLASVEERLVFYKKNERMLCDQIAVLKSDASFNEAEIITLKKIIEKLKKEKEDNLLKINNYDNATKSLDKVIGSQLIDNNKKGLGYNAILLPLTGLFAPPIIDLSYTGIEKFKEPEFVGYGVKVDKCVSETSPVVVEKKTVVPTIPKVDIVRPKQQEKPVRKTVRNFVPKAVLMKTGMRPVNATKPKDAYNAVKRNMFNAVKASACWVWMPKNRVVDHGRKIDLKRRIQRRVQQKQKDQEDEVFGRILSAKKMKSNDPPLSKGYTFGSGEDSLRFIELLDLCTKLIDKATILENALKQSKESHAQTLTMSMKKVKRLEDKIKFYNTSIKTRMVISDTKEYLISEDSVKQGRIEDCR
ncbi:hypothetical protein Tco_1226983 [Tanacetum coccineum]